MKFGQVKQYNKRNIFLKRHAENETERLVPNLLFLRKPLCEEKKNVICVLPLFTNQAFTS